MEKQRIVVKVGTSTLTHDSGNMDLRNMEHLVRALSDLHGMGHEIILVTSAAITVGTARLGLCLLYTSCRKPCSMICPQPGHASLI